MLPKQVSEFFHGAPSAVSECPFCHTTYVHTKIHLLWQEGGKHFLHLHCQKCAHAVLALLFSQQMGASFIGILTDLTFEDALALSSKKSISLDMVLNMHICLQEKASESNFFSLLVKESTHTRTKLKSKIDRKKRNGHNNAVLSLPF
ncbi:hypothetical protein CO172_00315 [Candidatus Uhrbacteria bacterium CG_4_9_14_3_um_filter_36_7]|uniref:Uncharacterized protein n=1 Tax=Candidatus Uhrbacteria bacterium CG_4_9_14_3_um_filter_36_7 TaxID=1975033 RepID=A0A2M7XIR9_9BACT|nr:MAG: hypothetical protein CO172_00315 [Candidatus Uhrbacteria bacterium CG_4_9_14_3_um_filter_36_7]